jgi:hypothetical protein
MDPRKSQFNLREIFLGMVKLTKGSRKERKYDTRGSSGCWNDDSEFATPIRPKKFHLPTPKLKEQDKSGENNQIGQDGNISYGGVSQFMPYAGGV